VPATGEPRPDDPRSKAETLSYVGMSAPNYPHAERVDVVDDLFGQHVADPYRWLEDAADPRTVTWSERQDALYASAREGWPAVKPMTARLTELLACGSVSAPAWRGERRFVSRRSGEQEMSVLLVIEPDGTERVLLDPMELDPEGHTTLDTWAPSKEGALLAYQLSVGGTEESTTWVMDVATGETVEGPIDRTRYSPIAWLPGGKAYYYVRRLPPEEVPAGETQYHRRVYLHRVGGDPRDDVLVFGEGQDKTNYYHVSVSMDGRWATLSASAGTAPRDDLWLADLRESGPETPRWTPVQVGVDASTSLRVGRADTPLADRVHIGTDRDAPRGRLCVASVGELGYEHWRDLVAEDPEAVLEDYAILDGPALARPLLLVGWTRHAVSEISVHDLVTGERLGDVSLPGLGSVGGLMERPEGGHEAWFGYVDHVTPPAVYRYDGLTGETTLWERAPGSVRVPEVSARQVVYPSKDGTPVRMFVLCRADLAPADGARPDAPRPVMLNGYGGFRISLTPAYSASMLAWVEGGGIAAVANLRGGSEEGEQWHRDGMREHKQNVFDDFDAAARWLVAEGWSRPEMIGVTGGSNGGLLVGAQLTQHPESVGAVVCSAPLLDMVRYERFGLGETWNDEYGTAADPTELGWLLSYSPYHHVKEGTAYPATLFTIFDGDTRVDPLHARKLAARLQHATSGSAPILVRRELNVGHGARALSKSVSLGADMLAFLAHTLGLDLTGAPNGDEAARTGREA
jgi:prolyl oligopeptidase